MWCDSEAVIEWPFPSGTQSLVPRPSDSSPSAMWAWIFLKCCSIWGLPGANKKNICICALAKLHKPSSIFHWGREVVACLSWLTSYSPLSHPFHNLVITLLHLIALNLLTLRLLVLSGIHFKSTSRSQCYFRIIVASLFSWTSSSLSNSGSSGEYESSSAVGS